MSDSKSSSMTSGDVLKTLHRLSAADRGWLIDNLPAQAKSRLLSVKAPPAPSPDGPQRLLRHVDPAALANLLQREPAWIAVALLRAHDWSWRDALLAALPTAVRAEVERGLAGPAHTTQLTDALVNIVAQRLAVKSAPTPVSKFEALVDRIALARSRKRWSINL